MSYYLRDCPNCEKKIGTALEKCPFCGQVVESISPSPSSASLSGAMSSNADTDTGQSALAYRLAAALVLVVVLINVATMIVEVVMGGLPATSLIVSSIIDTALAIGLLSLRRGARTWVLIRAILGAILLPILAYEQGGILGTIFSIMIQWGYSGSLILLLTGESKSWRLVVAVGIFAVMVLCINGGILALAMVAQVIQ